MIDNRLITFLDVAQTLNYTRTARNLNITQSTVSKHIKFLEDYYGTALVEYSSQKLNLTPTAQQILPYIEKIYFLNENLMTMIHTNNQCHSFTIGISFTLSDLFGDHLLEYLESLFPETQFNLIVNNTYYLNKLLSDQSIDFMLISGPLPTNVQNYSSGSFLDLYLTAFVRSDAQLSSTLLIQDLYDYPLYVREPGSGLSDALDFLLESKGILKSHFKHLYTLGNNQMIKRKVLNTQGIGILYSASINSEIKDGTLNPIFIEEFNHPFSCHYLFTENSQLLKSKIQSEIISYLANLTLD